MLELGKKYKLTIDRDVSPGLFLTNSEGEEVLLPGKFVPQNFEIGDELEVFIYLDNEERPIATTQEPFIQKEEFAYLYCTEVSKVGAFMDIGIDKELFVPFSNQIIPMQAKQWYVVYMYLDEKSGRLVGTSKLKPFLKNENIEVGKFDKVDLLVSHFSDHGANVIINGKYTGLIFKDVIFEDLRVGDKLLGYIKRVRDDGKIDVLLQPEGYKSIEPNADYIYEELENEPDNFLALNDKSSPEDIQGRLGISKKSFKKAVGNLYKNKVITIEEKGIRLIKNN